MSRVLPALGLVLALLPGAASPTNPDAARAAAASPLVQSAMASVRQAASQLVDAHLRDATVDALTNPATCVQHRRGLTLDVKRGIVRSLADNGFIDRLPTDDLVAAVFPPLNDDGSNCPTLRQAFEISPGGSGSHHDFPGGLPVHEAYNLTVARDLAKTNGALYLSREGRMPAPQINLDTLVAAVLWHDWAKAIVHVWNPDGSLTTEATIAGTGAHHILGLAEAMARNLPKDEILAQAAAHAAPDRGQNDQIVRWLRAAALIARKDPVASGWLVQASDWSYLLPVVSMGRVPGGDAQRDAFTATPEAVLTNIADANFYSVAATQQMDVVLPLVAVDFGFTPGTAAYRNGFRNPVLSFASADGLAALYRDGGLEAVRREADRALKNFGGKK